MPSDHKTCFPVLQTIISVPMTPVDLFQLKTEVCLEWGALFTDKPLNEHTF